MCNVPDIALPWWWRNSRQVIGKMREVSEGGVGVGCLVIGEGRELDARISKLPAT